MSRSDQSMETGDGGSKMKANGMKVVHTAIAGGTTGNGKDGQGASVGRRKMQQPDPQLYVN